LYSNINLYNFENILMHRIATVMQRPEESLSYYPKPSAIFKHSGGSI
jgi:hypothetical protein